MTDVEFNTEELKELLKIQGQYFKEKKPTELQTKIFIKTGVMYEAELFWDEDEEHGKA